MEKQFKKSKWIWKQNGAAYDDYALFRGRFFCNGPEAVYLDISADSICNVYINGKLAFFKQFADYPHHKLYDSVDITGICAPENELEIAVWYFGKDSATYYYSAPGLIFEIRQADRLLLASDEQLQSRTDSRYRIAYGKEITGQLGFSFFYDNAAVNDLPWGKSIAVNKCRQLCKNPLKPLMLRERTGFQILRQDERCALIDLGREEAGFLTLELDSARVQTVTVAYGEHIADGGVRRCIGTRDFSVEVRLAAGSNCYRNTFRRLAGRYLELFYDHPVHIRYLGLTPVEYPVSKRPFTGKNSLQQSIYDTAVRTLQLSMHEHYEDCPWREQAMYVLDSRNQMLCGYHCFDNGPYARENLILISKGLKEDGLLELTYPARNTPAIPFFSLMYPVAVQEYVQYTGDIGILPEVMPAVERIMGVFRRRSAGGQLISNLPYPYWNFYEWSKGSDHEDEITRSPDAPYLEQFDLILNCGYLLAENSYARLSGAQADLSVLREEIHRTFFDAQQGMYFASTAQRSLYTELGNSLAVLAGVAPETVEKDLVAKLMQPNGMVRLTLSMLGFKYDALLKADAANRAFIEKDLERIYGRMLQAGATSFWETEKGESDFDGAGSLCHGWAAMPVYYLSRFSETDHA